MERPWLNEPNHVDFKHGGYPCILHRGSSGAWCGYVGVPPGHPLHKVPYGTEAPLLRSLWEDRKQREIGESPSMGLMIAALTGDDTPTPERVLEVHGGITYADSCMEGGPICHKPEPGEPDDVWWFGFDCAHAGDFMPKHHDPESNMNKTLRATYPDWDALCSGHRGTYRDINYVRKETEELADQLRAIA